MNENNRNYRIDPERGIVVPNYCAAQLPKITVEIKSGRTTYRFAGRSCLPCWVHWESRRRP